MVGLDFQGWYFFKLKCPHKLLPTWVKKKTWFLFLVGGFNPFETYYIVKLDHFPGKGENNKSLKPPTSFGIMINPYLKNGDLSKLMRGQGGWRAPNEDHM